MKNILLLCCALLWTSILVAQEYPYKLTGFLGVKGGESFTYELHLKDSTVNTLTGYAFTYLQKGKDVKAELYAIIDKANKKLTIYERSILENNGFTSKAVICLVTASLLYDGKDHSLSGKLHTKTAGSGALPCTEGSISFINKLELDNLFEVIKKSEPETTNPTLTKALQPKPKIEDKQQKILDSMRKAEYAAIQKSKPMKPTEITEGKDKTFEWESNKVVLEIWDGTNEDGDQVTIELNGQPILSNYTLKNNKHTLTLDISHNELNFINIKALNEGGDPPNTANIKIYDGEKSYEIIAHNHAEKKATIKIKRKI